MVQCRPIIVSVDYCTSMTAVECLIATTIISALLNALSILLLVRVSYDTMQTHYCQCRLLYQYDSRRVSDCNHHNISSAQCLIYTPPWQGKLWYNAVPLLSVLTIVPV